MYSKRMTPSELLCAISELQDPKKTVKTDVSEIPDNEISIQDLFDLELFDTDPTLETPQTIQENAGQPEQKPVNHRIFIKYLINHEELKLYKLDETDVLMIAPIWSVYQSGRSSGWNYREIFKPLDDKKIAGTYQLTKLISLLDRKILHMDSRNNGDYHKNLRCLLENRFELDTMFINALLGNKVIANSCQAFREAIAANNGIVRPAMQLFSSVLGNYPEFRDSQMDEPGYLYGNVLKDIYDEVVYALENLPKDSVISTLKQEFALTNQEMLLALILLYHSDVSREDIGVEKVINLLSTGPEDAASWQNLLNPRSTLISKGIIDRQQRRRSWESELTLSEDIVTRLMSEEECVIESKTTDWTKLIQDDDRFVIVKTKQTIDQLILPDEIKDIIRSVVEKVKHPEKYDLAQWGLLTDSLSETVNNGALLLLHGLPGTGKTFAAGAIANSLGRKLVSINGPMLKSHWYGESQQIVKSCFQKMRNMVINCENPPVILLNEADQIIHTRLDLSQSCASTENAIQNIFLEELETFPGVFIATTNLMENIDEAFFRRFNYKIELPVPDADCRRQLWKLHLPETIPGAKYIDIDFLAETYPLSGGQIKLIVANACSHAMMKQIANQHITQVDVERYIIIELGVHETHSDKVLGFKCNS